MCVLRVSGQRFDVDGWLKSSSLGPCSVFRAGESRRISDPDGERHQVSGFKIEVSRGSRSTLVGQVSDAIAFLKEHRDELQALRGTPGVEDMRLDFPIDLRIDRKTVFAQFDYFPAELVSLAGALGLGLELSIYPVDLEELARRRARSPNVGS